MLQYNFQVTKFAREKYKIEDSFFSANGTLVFADFAKARSLTEKINWERINAGMPDQQIMAGELYAVVLMHELFHFIIRKYENSHQLNIFSDAKAYLAGRLSNNALENVFQTFLDVYPPPGVYNNLITAKAYLNGTTKGRPNKEIILEELILINIQNNNPAAAKIKELYTDEILIKKTEYKKLILECGKYLDNESPLAKKGIKLFSTLKKPIQQNLHSLEQQLNFIKNEYADLLGEDILNKILIAGDLIKEDYKIFIHHGGGENITPPVPVYFDEDKIKYLKETLGKGGLSPEGTSLSVEEEVEQFTEDTDWIPEVVMLAKNIFVWLFQLSKKYKRDITTLDQIPDEELDMIASWNFTSIWLIGIWERSPASKKIKQLTGNPQAAASAYSLFDYEIARELGGENAFQNLKNRAWQRGIRMASDMVPNHTGIYSNWIINKPHYYIQSSKPPYPGYSFTGPNLSEDHRVEIRIEDKYYSRKDAAVVFERKDNFTGENRYIYHGNDGTNMPWNDTAQLNLMMHEVRESLIQTIMHVARKTPIIRFDAAMTLAKKHYQRLWFPDPGSGGAIPSRSQHAMTKDQFDSVMPNEFWREVVERINELMPNTLLLAEAFWLMESYFVRTLGMHRVYNSAFMHMMMKEENDKYRNLIINTLEFNPEILKRYVNFMSNPDEETAINQFGKGDKYFGVAVMMVTLPGLPMFGHGQMEGFSEKYGMEYKRAYYDETPDEHLIHRHQREIFPLLKKRYLFSQVENFEFYDFDSGSGKIDENVFAFSNKSKAETVLVIYNNSYYETSGSIKYSNHKSISAENERSKKRNTLNNLLNIKSHPKYFYQYKDHRTGLKYLLSGMVIAEQGFKLHLFGYQYRVCLNFKEIYDYNDSYSKLYFHLNGKGVYSLEDAIDEMEMLPLHSTIENFYSADNIEKFKTYINQKVDLRKKPRVEVVIPGKITKEFSEMVRTFNQFSESADADLSLQKLITQLQTSRKFYQLWLRLLNRKNVTKWMKEAESFLPIKKQADNDRNITLLFIFSTFKSVFVKNDVSQEKIKNKWDELLLTKSLQNIFGSDGANNNSLLQISLLKLLVIKSNSSFADNDLITSGKDKKVILKQSKPLLFNYFSALLEDEDVNKFISVNEFESVVYFNKERFEILLSWYFLVSILQHTELLSTSEPTVNNKIKATIKLKKLTNAEFEKKLNIKIKMEYSALLILINEIEKSGYDLNKFKTGFKRMRDEDVMQNELIKNRKR